MKRTVFKLALLCTAPLLVIFLFVVPAARSLNPFVYARESARRQSCLNNLMQMSRGFQAYAMDHDHHFPPVKVNGTGIACPTVPGHPTWLNCAVVGWSDALELYTKSSDIEMCPGEINSHQRDPRQAGYNDYWMNSHASGKAYSKFRLPASTILTGDGDGGSAESNATYSMSHFPVNWRTVANADQPPWFRRHLNGANYCFVDGHTKWLQPHRIVNEPGKLYTFSTR